MAIFTKVSFVTDQWCKIKDSVSRGSFGCIRKYWSEQRNIDAFLTFLEATCSSICALERICVHAWGCNCIGGALIPCVKNGYVSMSGTMQPAGVPHSGITHYDKFFSYAQNCDWTLQSGDVFVMHQPWWHYTKNCCQKSTSTTIL